MKIRDTQNLLAEYVPSLSWFINRNTYCHLRSKNNKHLKNQTSRVLTNPFFTYVLGPAVQVNSLSNIRHRKNDGNDFYYQSKHVHVSRNIKNTQKSAFAISENESLLDYLYASFSFLVCYPLIHHLILNTYCSCIRVFNTENTSLTEWLSTSRMNLSSQRLTVCTLNLYMALSNKQKRRLVSQLTFEKRIFQKFFIDCSPHSFSVIFSVIHSEHIFHPL